ncbi:hypothetical protein ABC766_00200 [Methylobacterium fujisawaense]|jgi:hypothetical protein|uniref:hypothetical protein n=1 Tax=Methylobacterium fujisawaense TaxID=107400 RepID=UPI0031F5253B
MSDADPTQPGPAGLFFRTDRLSASGWHQEHQARSRLERWCSECGQRACYGFGETLRSEGVLSCSGPDCMDAAEATARERDCPSPPAKPSDDTAAPDLFGAAA